MASASPFHALRRAIAKVGSQSAMARLLGVSQAAVSKWVRNSKHLPAEHVLRVQDVTGVSRHDLRPDLYPVDVEEPKPSAPPSIVPANENGILS